MKRPLAVVLAALLAAAAFAQPKSAARSEAAVRAARDSFNRAIESRNANAIGALLAPTYSVVTGRGDKMSGRDEEVRRWTGRFRADRRLSYRRTPNQVMVNEAWGLAHETGSWEGTFTSEAQTVRSSGVYSARWQRSESGRWMVDSEIFVTLVCDGPPTGCFKPDPIE